jgi:hypothetical protein
VTVINRALLPTVTARDWRSGKASAATLERNSRPLNETLCASGQAGSLNPEWLELFMMFPLHWTDPAKSRNEIGRSGNPVYMHWATLAFRPSVEPSAVPS